MSHLRSHAVVGRRADRRAIMVGILIYAACDQRARARWVTAFIVCYLAPCHDKVLVFPIFFQNGLSFTTEPGGEGGGGQGQGGRCADVAKHCNILFAGSPGPGPPDDECAAAACGKAKVGLFSCCAAPRCFSRIHRDIASLHGWWRRNLLINHAASQQRRRSRPAREHSMLARFGSAGKPP